MPINSTAGKSIYIGGVMAATDDDVVISDFTGQSWTEIGAMINLGKFGGTANVIKSDRIANKRTLKAKGTIDYGSISLVAGLDPADAGQVACLAALTDPSSYAFKIVWDDAPVGGTPTVRYIVGLVTTGEEEYDTGNDEMKFNVSVEVNSNIVAVARTSNGTAPANTVLPAITGTATVGDVLTVSSGTWSGTTPLGYTYQWYRDGVSIPGATANTYTAVADDVGKALVAEVTASNVIGSATAISAATADVAAS